MGGLGDPSGRHETAYPIGSLGKGVVQTPLDQTLLLPWLVIHEQWQQLGNWRPGALMRLCSGSPGIREGIRDVDKQRCGHQVTK